MRGFCAHIMADNRPFFTDYHLNMGDEQVCPWVQNQSTYKCPSVHAWHIA